MKMPRRLILAIVVTTLLTCAVARAQAPAPTPQVVLDAAIALIKEQALRRDAVAWDVVEPRVRAMAAGAVKTSDVYLAIRYLIDQLGDQHSRLTVPAQTAAFLSGGAQNPEVETRTLSEAVGYVRVPGYTGADASAMWRTRPARIGPSSR